MVQEDLLETGDHLDLWECLAWKGPKEQLVQMGLLVQLDPLVQMELQEIEESQVFQGLQVPGVNLELLVLKENVETLESLAKKDH